MRAADALLAHVGGDVDDGRHHALCDKAAAVTDHRDGFAVAGKQGVRCVAHVGTRGRVGGQHAALGGRIHKQHVDAHGAGWIEALDHGHGGDVKTQRGHEGQRLGRGRRTGFDFGAQVLEQLQQLHAAGGAGRDPDGWDVLHHGHGWFGGHLRCAVHVFVEAFADFFADHATGQPLGGDDVRAVARLFVILVVNRFNDVV